MTEKFSGVHWMLATPFHEDESIDSASLAKLSGSVIQRSDAANAKQTKL